MEKVVWLVRVRIDGGDVTVAPSTRSVLVVVKLELYTKSTHEIDRNRAKKRKMETLENMVEEKRERERSSNKCVVSSFMRGGRRRTICQKEI